MKTPRLPAGKKRVSMMPVKTRRLAMTILGGLLALAAAATVAAIVAPIRGDVDSNNRGDIITRDANGALTINSMNGFAVLAHTNLFHGESIGPYTLDATGDFDFDGTEDFVFDYQGQHYVVFNGTNPPPTAGLFGGNIAPWHVVAGGDFDGDGKCDLVIQDGSENIYATVLMNGTNVLAGDYLWGGGDISPWHVIGGGDFNGDGKADLVIQDGDNSTYGIIYMDGNTMLDANYATVDGTLTDLSPYKISAISDLDGDGKCDLVLTSTYDSSQFVLFMNGYKSTSGDYINGTTNSPLSGTIIGPR
jgi:hypothetical protein